MISRFSGTREIRIGGGELVVAFFEEALRLRVKRLLVLTPYVDDSAFAHPLLQLWQRTIATTDSTIVVRTPAAADAILRSTRPVQRQFSIRINPILHAKVFLGWCPGAQLALVGSQNLTGAALRVNKEIGILIRPIGDEMRETVSQLRAALSMLVDTSSLYVQHRIGPAVAGSNPRSNGQRKCDSEQVEVASLRVSKI